MTTPRLPRVIWMLWLQGWDDAPRIVKACRQSWAALNPEWTLRSLDRASVGTYIADPEARSALDHPDLPPEACSDRLRIALLAQHGGVWADATTYCLRPLNDWLHEAAVAGFFAFDRPGPDRLLSSWFLAAAPDSRLIEEWSRRTRDYWRGRQERHHYFWFHYLFGEAYESDPAFREAYDRVPKISAVGPHAYQTPLEKLFATTSDSDRRRIEEPDLPLLKLTRHLPNKEVRAGSVLDYLCTRVQQ